MMGVLRVFIARVPRPIGNWVADRIGDVVYHVAVRSRRASASNLRHVMPHASKREVMRAVHGVFHNVMRNYFDLCRAPDMSDEEIDERTTFDEEGWRRVVEAHRQGRGIILVSAHFGSFDMTTQVISRRGLPLNVLIAQVKPAWLSDFISELRGARGLNLLQVQAEAEEGNSLNLGALKRSMEILRKGGVLGVLADRNMEQKGAVIRFFGYPTVVASGVAKMALRTRSVVFVGLCERLPKGRYSVTFSDIIEPQGSASNDQDVAALLTEIFSNFEPYIRRKPEQWVLLQPVWPVRET